MQPDEQLNDLRFNWDEAYVIEHLDDGRWLAQRRDDRQTLLADSPEELRGMIRADYDAHPVPRLPE